MQTVIPTETIYERVIRDNEKADVEQMRADIDYIAMMTNVEIPDREEQRDEQEL